MSRTFENLSRRREKVEQQRGNFKISQSTSDSVPQDIFRSWQRSAHAVEKMPQHAPLDDASLVENLWRQSPLSIGAQLEQSNMIQLTKEADLVVAIADPCGRLLWTHASNHMRHRAENLNFIAGGHWNELVVGTNAVGLALKLKRPVTVFSSEHYLPFVQDWVCYAAPIIHPRSGECVGILDMSTTWKKHTPLGQSAIAQIANSIAQNLPCTESRAELEIRALGQPSVIYQGKTIKIPQRELEILCLLALNPEGLTLEQLHTALYNDYHVSTATLKTHVSHLRHFLGGKIGSRPYRLTMPYWADFISIWEALNQQKANEAMLMYRGEFLASSQSPEIEQWRYCIDAMMTRVVDTCQSPGALTNKLQESTSGSNVVRERLLELLPNLQFTKS
ncbi:MAG: hypothetical protein ACI8XX_000815 [Polaribacter sp.]|jgi:hypothetical protein